MTELKYSGLTPDQFLMLNAVNTAPKAILHLCVEASEWNTAKELDAKFMDLQGSEPAWDISRGYCRSMILGGPKNAGTFDIETGPFAASLSDRGRFSAVPVAAHLFTIADMLGVRQTTLTGESTSPKSSNNTMELRYRAAQHIAVQRTDRTFTTGILSEELGCSLSAASSLVSELARVQFLNESGDKPTTRNGYAGYLVAEHVPVEALPNEDPLLANIREELQNLVGQSVDAKIMTKLLGYNIKYAGGQVADYLEILQQDGTLNLVFTASERLRSFRVTPRGLNASKAVINICAQIENPDSDFLRRGRILAQSIRKDPATVSRVLARTPTKRGQRKSAGPSLRTDTPAVIALAAQMPKSGHLKTSQAQELTGTSRTATARLLNKGVQMGLVNRTKVGRDCTWEVI